jgi:hypothetical protein
MATIFSAPPAPTVDGLKITGTKAEVTDLYHWSMVNFAFDFTQLKEIIVPDAVLTRALSNTVKDFQDALDVGIKGGVVKVRRDFRQSGFVIEVYPDVIVKNVKLAETELGKMEIKFRSFAKGVRVAYKGALSNVPT